MNTTGAFGRSARFGIATLALLLVEATGAWALSWNSSSQPLTVTGYGSTGEGYGTWFISTGSDGTRYRATSYMRINNADDHEVYSHIRNWTSAGFCYAPEFLSCTVDYSVYNSMQSGRHDYSFYVGRSSSAPLHGAAEYHRAEVKMRLDIPWRSDPSSTATWTNGIDY